MPASNSPLLIVNADDFGWNRGATDLTAECFAAGQITSTTALMYMEDSDRAAELALARDIPVGLHLNLTDPFTAASIPEPVRERQARACRIFGGPALRKRSWTYDPRIRGLAEAAIRDQLERFRALFGREPTHVDGHNHVQVCPNVITAQALAGQKTRDALWSYPSTRSAMGLARALRRGLTARGHLTTRYFLDLAELHRGSPAQLTERIDLASRSSVEVMCHPGFDHELEALRSAAWCEAIEAAPLGSYRELV